MSEGNKPFKFSEQSLLYKVGAIGFLIVAAAVYGVLQWNSIQRRDRNAQQLGEHLFQKEEAPPPADDAPPPAPPQPTQSFQIETVSLPAPPPLQFTQSGDQRVAAASVQNRRARRTDVRLFMPPGDHTNASVPCVFICPAGSNMMVGVPFESDEHQAYLPLLDRGIAVCCYTLDGTVKDMQSASAIRVSVATGQYVKAEGGLFNLVDAIDTVLAGAPQIDPKRLGTAGHSSAGTIALMAAAREPRIKTAAALAPVIDLPAALGSVAVEQLGAEQTQFVYRNSPSHVSQWNGSVFIYQCRDDQTVPFGPAETLKQKFPSNVTLELTDSGGHRGAHDQGREPAFDFLARTLNSKNP